MTTAKRSWTDEEDVSKNRWAMLALLGFGLLVSLGILAVLNYRDWFPSFPSTLVVSITVKPTSMDLPSFAEWDSEKLIEAAEKARVLHWKRSGPNLTRELGTNATLESASAVNLASVLESIAAPKRDDDILIVLLRCHAAVTKHRADPKRIDSQTQHEAAEGWRCELLVGGTEPFGFDRALEALAKKGYRNTIVLADVSDLFYVPSRGWAFNPIASYIQKACASVQNSLDENRNLWVLCAASDGQAPHVDRHGKSLFQEACAKAFDLSKPDAPISFASYCDSINRYCAGASQGNQTPILYLARRDGNSSEACTWGTKGWEQAEKISWARRSSSPPSKTNSAEEATDEPKKDSPKEAEGKSAEPASEKKIEGTWAAIDAIRGIALADKSHETEKEWTWKPSDYAPLAWRLWIQETSKKSLMWSKRSLAEPVQDFSEDWKRFASNREAMLDTWTKPLQSRLSPDEAKRWLDLRNQFRIYFDSIAEVTSWRDLVFPLAALGHSPIQRLGTKEDLTQTFHRAIQDLDAFRQGLPRNPIESGVLEKMGSLNLRSSPFEALRKLLDQEVEQLLDERWTWSTEYRCLMLLRSPLLTAEQRQRLESALQGHEIVAVIPATEFATSMDLAPDQRMQVFASAASRMSAWYTEPSWYTDQKLTSLLPDPQESILEWGQKYGYHHEQVRRSIQDSMTSFQRWHYLSIADLAAMGESRNPLFDSNPIFYPGNARRVILLAKCGSEESQWVDLKADDGPVPVVLQLDYAFDQKPADSPQTGVLSWHVDNALARLMRLTVDRETWPQGENRPLHNRVFRFHVERVESSKAPLPLDAQIRIDFVGDGDASSRETLVIPVFQNAHSIGLIAIQQPSMNLLPIQTNYDNVLKLSGPAWAQIESRFALQLQNTLDKERIAKLFIYAKEEDRDNQKPLAVSEQVLLKKATPTQPSRETVKFATEPGPSSVTHTKLLCVVEEYATLPIPAASSEIKPDGTNATSASEEPVRSFSYPLELIPDLQLSKVIDVKAPAVEKGSGAGPRLTFELQSNFIQQFQPKLVPITVRWWKKRNPDDLDEAPVEELETILEERPLLLNMEKKSDFAKVPKKGNEYDLYGTVDIGNVPRKLRYKLRQDRKDPDLDQLVGVPFPPRIVNPAIQAIARDDSETAYSPIDLPDSQLIFPNYTWGKSEERWNKAEADTGPISYEALRVSGMFDGTTIRWRLFDPSAEVVDENRTESNVSQPFAMGAWPDRTVSATPRFQKGEFSFSFTVTELQEQIPIRRWESNSPKRWRLELDAGHEPPRRFDVVFDREAPVEGKLIGPNGESDLKIEPNDILEIRLVPLDPQVEVLDRGGAGVQDGQLWLARDRVADFNKDTAIFFQAGKPGPEDRPEDRWVGFQLTGAAFLEAKSKLGAGPYYLHARTFDRAGNVQSSHKPLRIEWVPPIP